MADACQLLLLKFSATGSRSKNDVLMLLQIKFVDQVLRCHSNCYQMQMSQVFARQKMLRDAVSAA